MYEIVKEAPDAFLYFISPDPRIKFLRGEIKDLNLTNKVKIISYVTNISHYFLNASALLCPSKIESFPIVMNEGKAHGVPIIAFNVSYSPSYQKGVILVDMLNYTQMAKEAIKLLNNYDYRKKMGIEAKLSLKEYSNEETANKWIDYFLFWIKKFLFLIKNYKIILMKNIMMKKKTNKELNLIIILENHIIDIFVAILLMI